MPGTVIRRRQIGSALTRCCTALSKTAICSRSCRQVASNGRTIKPISGAPSSLDPPIKSEPPTGAGQQAEGLQHAAYHVGEPRRHAHELRASSKESSSPMRIERLYVDWPIPSRAQHLRQPFRVVLVVLLSRICSAAFTRLASRHSTSSPALRRPCTSQGVIEPVSIPTLTSTTPACLNTRAEIAPGSVTHAPRQSRRPCSSTTQIAVVFCDTSSPT